MVSRPVGRIDADRGVRENPNDDLVLPVGMGVLSARALGPVVSEEIARVLAGYYDNRGYLA